MSALSPQTVQAMYAWERGELAEADTIRLFSELVASGDAWKLQGFYGRFAAGLIETRWLTSAGAITSTARRRVPELKEVPCPAELAAQSRTADALVHSG